MFKRPNSAYLTGKSSSFVFLVRLYMWVREAEFGPKELTSRLKTITAIHRFKMSSACHVFFPYSSWLCILIFWDVTVWTVSKDFLCVFLHPVYIFWLKKNQSEFVSSICTEAYKPHLKAFPKQESFSKAAALGLLTSSIVN